MRVLPGVVATVGLLATSWQAAAQAPLPVVERVSSHFGRSTRVSLFSNRVAVVAIRSESEDFVQLAALAEDEYMVYLQALDRLSREIVAEPVTSDIESRDSSTTLTLYLGPDAPRKVTYSPLASLHLSVGKIAAIMDDIEQRVLATMPETEELRRWLPVVGDLVALRHGGFARVTEIAEDGTVVLKHEENSVTYTVAPASRAEVILEVIADRP